MRSERRRIVIVPDCLRAVDSLYGDGALAPPGLGMRPAHRQGAGLGGAGGHRLGGTFSVPTPLGGRPQKPVCALGTGGSGRGASQEWVRLAYGEQVELLHPRSICDHGALCEKKPSEDFAADDRHRAVSPQFGQEEALNAAQRPAPQQSCVALRRWTALGCWCGSVMAPSERNACHLRSVRLGCRGHGRAVPVRRDRGGARSRL